MDRTSMEYLKGGALKTASWARVTGTNTGIVRITYTEGATVLIASDIGKTIANGTATGTILDYNTISTPKVMWIRPTDNTATHNWSATSGVMTITGSTGNPSQASASVTGESTWANFYSLGTIEKFTHLYVYQNGLYLTKYKSATIDWWGNTLVSAVWADGHIDILVNVREVGVLIDAGFVTVLARQYGKTYDNFIVDINTGGRNPIPLAAGADLNNIIGFRQFTSTVGVGTFNVNNFIYAPAAGGWTAATKRGVLTAVSGSPGTTPTLTYYPIGDLTDFVSTDTIQDYTGTANGTATCTVNVVSAFGPSTTAYDTGVTITHGVNTTFDIDENGTNENYSIVINLTSFYTVAQGYERTKYLTRYGGTTIGDTNTIQGQRYIGSDYKIVYVTLTGAIAQGAVVTQLVSLATGTVVAHNTTAKILILRNSRGTFNNTDNVRVDASNLVATPTSTALAPIKAAPFGTFAGGTWFGAPGVVLQNTLLADANKYQLTDDNGNVIKAPTKVTITVGNTRTGTPPAGDRIAVFRLTAAGGTIKKDQFAGTIQAASSTSIAVMGSAIPADFPGKTAGGVIRLVKTAANQEYRLRFSSWTASTYTLAFQNIASADAGTTTTNITKAGAFATNKVGDLVLNVTRANAVSYITVVNADTNNVTIAPAIALQTTADNIQINALPVATVVADTWYAPLIDAYETVGSGATPGTETSNVTYLVDIPVRVRARSAGVILPYEADATVTSTGLTNNIIRTADTIFT